MPPELLGVHPEEGFERDGLGGDFEEGGLFTGYDGAQRGIGWGRSAGEAGPGCCGGSRFAEAALVAEEEAFGVLDVVAAVHTYARVQQAGVDLGLRSPVPTPHLRSGRR